MAKATSTSTEKIVLAMPTSPSPSQIDRCKNKDNCRLDQEQPHRTYVPDHGNITRRQDDI